MPSWYSFFYSGCCSMKLAKILAAVSILSIFQGSAADPVPYPFVTPLADFKWEMKNREITIKRFLGASFVVVIPQKVQNIPVTKIGSNVFFRCRDLTSVKFPESVNSIGPAAFNRCIRLSSIVIPDGVTSIRESTFFRCSELSSVMIPQSVTSIKEYAFSYCKSLKSITIPEHVKSLGSNAFRSCENLESVTFLGDAPEGEPNVFENSTPVIYRQPEAKGWSETWCGRPVKLIAEKPNL